MGAGNKQRHPPLTSTVAEKGLRTLDFGLRSLDFDLSECVPTSALMDGGTDKRELHYIVYEITFFTRAVRARVKFSVAFFFVFFLCVALVQEITHKTSYMTT